MARGRVAELYDVFCAVEAVTGDETNGMGNFLRLRVRLVDALE
jgi:hypothetical protein